MHSIKRNARRVAWNNDGSNFNPFVRHHSTSSSASRGLDPEQGLGNAQTWPAESEAQPQLAHYRSEGDGLGPSINGNLHDKSQRDTETINTQRSDGTLVNDSPVDATQRRTNQAFNETKETIPEESESAPRSSNGDDVDSEEERKRRHDDMMKKKIPAMQQLRIVLFPHWYTINWLLIAAPVGIALSQVKVDPLAVFLVNFIAIIPLAGMLSFATEELALRVGETLGGLLNASFGNAVELIVAIIALVHKEIVIVKTSLIGSMLSNLLIVLGMCFFFGGINRMEQFFNITVAQTAASLLALAVGSLLIPTAFTWSVNPNTSNLDEQLSHGVAIILLVLYMAYLFFQLKTHVDMYNEPSQKVEKRKGSKKTEGDAKRGIAAIGGIAAGVSGGHALQERPVQVPDDEPEEPSLSLIGALITLLGATALIGVCAEFLVDSIQAVTCKYHVSETFVGLILLPIVGNAAEHATAVTVAIKDKMDLAIGVAVGSSMQIALLVLPLSVVLGWIIGADMTLVFDNFQIVILFVAIILVNYLIGDGKSHWLEGFILMSLYVIIAVAAWFYPIQSEGQCT